MFIEGNYIKLNKVVNSQKVDMEATESTELVHIGEDVGEKQHMEPIQGQKTARYRFIHEGQTFSEIISWWPRSTNSGLQEPESHSGVLSRIRWDLFLSVMFKWNGKAFDDKEFKTLAPWKIQWYISDRWRFGIHF